MNNGIATRSPANEALKDLDQALENTDVKLSFLGSIQNQLKHALDNNYGTSKNATISAGRISDTDYAIESAEITNSQILLQAGSSAMSQVKEIASAALPLLSS